MNVQFERYYQLKFTLSSSPIRIGRTDFQQPPIGFDAFPALAHGGEIAEWRASSTMSGLFLFIDVQLTQGEVTGGGWVGGDRKGGWEFGLVKLTKIHRRSVNDPVQTN